jgi:hypothetical protein
LRGIQRGRRHRCTRNLTFQTVKEGQDNVNHPNGVNTGNKGGHTSSRNMAKQKTKMIGPARSASSIMRSSMRLRGLSTVIDLAPICWKLIPSSETKCSILYIYNPLEVNTHPQVAVARPRILLFQMHSRSLPAAGYFLHILVQPAHQAHSSLTHAHYPNSVSTQDTANWGPVRRTGGALHWEGLDCSTEVYYETRTRRRTSSSLATLRWTSSTSLNVSHVRP